MENILIIDDDEELANLLFEYLEPEGFSVNICLRGDEGASLALQGQWDAVILDIMLPGLNGIEVLKKIRKKSLIPVLMLTAKGDDFDRILGLEMGADDYLPKPFNPRELLARLRAILRRQQREITADNSSTLSCRSLLIHPKTRSITIKGKPVEITSTEFSVLMMLVANAGTVVTKELLYKDALGRPLTPHDRSIDMHISHLRRKLSDCDPSLVIHTIRGAGYQMET